MFRLTTTTTRVPTASSLLVRHQSTATGAAVSSSSTPTTPATSTTPTDLSLMNAAYPTRVPRGTAGIYESKHHAPIRKGYQAYQLRANFWGPQEWFYLARKQAERRLKKDKSFTDIVAMQKSIQRHDQEAPLGYPFLPQDASTKLPNNSTSVQSLWERFRHACATLYPTSAYAVEERLVDAWNFFVQGKPAQSSLPKRVVVGGAAIQLTNPYAKRARGVPEKHLQEAGCSEEALKFWNRLHSDCNPFSLSKVSPKLLETFLERGLRTEADVALVLPRMVQRWRWLTMGAMQEAFQEPSVELTDRMLDVCGSFGRPEIALTLLRHRPVYKLATPSVSAMESLMERLALRHVSLSQAQTSSTPSGGDTWKAAFEDPTPSPYANKRYAPKHAFPFRMGPRFYFYRHLPFVLNPEPSLFAEIPLPRLPTDNDTKRLLPDDQRKKLNMLIEEQQRKYFREEYDPTKESPALRALTDVYRLFHYATSASPYYYSMKATHGFYDALTLAGLLGGTEEGCKRSLVTAHEALEQGKLTPSAYACVQLLGMETEEGEKKEKSAEDIGVPDVSTWDVSKVIGETKDRLGLGFLNAFTTTSSTSMKHRMEWLKAVEVDENKHCETVQEMRQRVVERVAPVVKQQLQGMEAEVSKELLAALKALPQAKVLLDRPELRPFLRKE